MTESYASGPLDGIALENVCGLWPGSDPRMRHEVIILSSLYPHLVPRVNGHLYNVAHDNASPTTGRLRIPDPLRLLERLLRPATGHEVVRLLARAQQVERGHVELQRGAALQEAHGVVFRNRASP